MAREPLAPIRLRLPHEGDARRKTIQPRPCASIQGLELWRPVTSLIYLGKLSMSWLTNVYFLTQHGTRLELVSGTAEQTIFLLLVVR